MLVELARIVIGEALEPNGTIVRQRVAAEWLNALCDLAKSDNAGLEVYDTGQLGLTDAELWAVHRQDATEDYLVYVRVKMGKDKDKHSGDDDNQTDHLGKGSDGHTTESGDDK